MNTEGNELTRNELTDGEFAVVAGGSSIDIDWTTIGSRIQYVNPQLPILYDLRIAIRDNDGRRKLDYYVKALRDYQEIGIDLKAQLGVHS